MRPFALMISCLALGALFFAGSASGWSRGFRLKNNSDQTLTLIDVAKVPARLCNKDHCVNSHRPKPAASATTPPAR